MFEAIDVPCSRHPAKFTCFDALSEKYIGVRRKSLKICEGLEPEDYVVQSMPDVSPPKWHLAHTTWFFENFILKLLPDRWVIKNHSYLYLYNSYYETSGQFHPRTQRGLLSRPSLSEILQWRHSVDRGILDLLSDSDLEDRDKILSLVAIGLQHEQQHQELMLMDIKYNFWSNPLLPVYESYDEIGITKKTASKQQWLHQPEAICSIGYDGPDFSYDNERPAHNQLTHNIEISSRLVTNGEWLSFINDGGYHDVRLWLSEGWSWVQNHGIKSPLYWFNAEDHPIKLDRFSDGLYEFTLYGPQPIDHDLPVSHISYYEADAFARWSGCRLPSEAEWEAYARKHAVTGNLAYPGKIDADFSPYLHPRPAECNQVYGDLWEWTSSSYRAYPGFSPEPGVLGEYNGKFMCNQYVLRGGSFASPQDHIRPSYRNFFPAHSRWQFSGMRIVRDL